MMCVQYVLNDIPLPAQMLNLNLRNIMEGLFVSLIFGNGKNSETLGPDTFVFQVKCQETVVIIFIPRKA